MPDPGASADDERRSRTRPDLDQSGADVAVGVGLAQPVALADRLDAYATEVVG